MNPPEQASAAELLADRRRYVAVSAGTSDVFVSYAEGARLRDVTGREYIDFAGGVGALNLGHRPAAVVEAVKLQADRFLHVGYSAASFQPYVDVCKRLVDCHPGAGPYKALLFNSGVEAVENAIKIARAATKRPAIICFDNAFHGRSMLGATLSYRARPYKRGFGPSAPEVYRAAAPYEYRGVTSDDSLASLRALLYGQVDPEQVAAVIYEPVQGEGGFIPAPPDFLPRLAALCHSHGILLICDEIQSGMCRTGLPAATMHYPGVVPDLIAWGKSLGGGLPLAAVTGHSTLMDAVHPGGLASGTTGGNPLSCVAATVVLDTVLDPEFQTAALAFGERLRKKVDTLGSRCDAVGEVRGLGAMVALELVTDTTTRAPDAACAARTVAAAQEAGLLIKSCGVNGNVIRILVPVTATDLDIDEGLAVLENALRASTRQPERDAVLS